MGRARVGNIGEGDSAEDDVRRTRRPEEGAGRREDQRAWRARGEQRLNAPQGEGDPTF